MASLIRIHAAGRCLEEQLKRLATKHLINIDNLFIKPAEGQHLSGVSQFDEEVIVSGKSYSLVVSAVYVEPAKLQTLTGITRRHVHVSISRRDHDNHSCF